MKRTLAITLLTLGAMSASAADYHFSLHQDATIAGKALKAGDYKVAVNQNTAVLKRGKETIEVPVRTETASNKFSTTQIQFAEANSVQEIRVGGTNTKLVFSGASNNNSGM